MILEQFKKRFDQVLIALIVGLYFFTTNWKITPIVTVLIVILWTLILIINIKYDSPHVFLKMMIFSLPLSHSPALLGIYENPSFTWFTIFSSLFIFSVLLKIFIQRETRVFIESSTAKITIVVLLVFLFVLLAQISTGGIINISRIVQISLFLLTIYASILLKSIKYKSTYRLPDFLQAYNFVVLLSALMVLTQFLLYSLGIEFGLISLFLPARTAFGFLNFDFSFLSLFLVSNLFFLISRSLKEHRLTVFQFFVIFIQLSSSIITSARTGIVSITIVLLIVFVISVFIRNDFNISKNNRRLIFIILIGVLLVLLYLMFIFRGFDDSGRGSINRESISAFMKSPIFGFGFGWLSNWNVVPHNFFVQYLVQSGIIFTFSITVLLVTLILESLKKDTSLALNILVVAVGSMFIPDVIHSRFLTILLILPMFISPDNKISKPTILHVLSSGGFSGAEKIAISIIKSSPEGYDSMYVSPSGYIQKILKKERISTITCENITPLSLMKITSDNKISVIYAHDFKASLTVAFTPSYAKKISHIHQNPIWFSKKGLRSLVFLIATFFLNKIVFVSEQTLNEFSFRKFIIHKSIVLPNYVDHKEVTQHLSDKKITKKVYDLAFLGRLEAVKDPIKFLEIVSHLKVDNPNIKALIIGDGSLSSGVENYIIKYKLEDNVTKLGYCENPYIFLSQARILVMPSVWEGFGLAAVEAQILGLPVIASPVGGLLNIVDGNNGLFASDTNEFVNKINTVLMNETNYVEFKKNAIESSKRFTDLVKWKSDISNIIN